MDVRTWRPLLVGLALIAAACGSAPDTGGSPPGPPKSVPALKLAVLDAVGGHLDYCDPDYYPVAHGDPVSNAKERLPMIEADTASFQAILEHEHLAAGQEFTDQELVAINEDYKQMQAIELQPSGNVFRFRVMVPAGAAERSSEEIAGTVTTSGSVKIEARKPGPRPNCPICLAAGVRIATPGGDVAVQDVRVGTPVWTLDLRGNRMVGVVLKTGHMAAPPGHHVVVLTLADGRTVTASPGHPTADGRMVGRLRPGDVYDGSRVASTRLEPYAAGFTYDLLVSGPTGAYVANGVPLGSTLHG